MKSAITRMKSGETIVPKEAYEEVEASELVTKESAYRGRRVTVTGTVLEVQEGQETHQVLLHVPSRSGKAFSDDVAIIYQGDTQGLVKGATATVWGLAEGLNISTRAGRCGITVIPVIKAKALEWRG